MTKLLTGALAAGLLLLAAASTSLAQDLRPVKQTAAVAVFDFASEKSADESAKKMADRAQDMANAIRMKLARHDDYFVLDRLSAADLSKPLPVDADPNAVTELMVNKAGCNIGITGTFRKHGDNVELTVRCIDVRDPNEGFRDANAPAEWTKTFTDNTERYQAVIATAIIQQLTGQAEWVPPQVGDVPEPKHLGKPLNVNGDFESPNHQFWEAPDNAATFIDKGPAGRGNVLRVDTRLMNDPWSAYHREMRIGSADGTHPPHIPLDTSAQMYGSVGGNEGVHFESNWMEATPGWRYWVTCEADHAGPKIFIKGFTDWSAHADGLSETSLFERKITPEAFAAMTPAQRKDLIADDVKKHPDRYRREVYRWDLKTASAVATPSTTPGWKHYAGYFPPRGGLPKAVDVMVEVPPGSGEYQKISRPVQWLQIQVYVYWPAQVYQIDDVYLYKDPDQKQPLSEEAARTPKIPTTQPAAAASKPKDK